MRVRCVGGVKCVAMRPSCVSPREIAYYCDARNGARILVDQGSFFDGHGEKANARTTLPRPDILGCPYPLQSLVT